MFEFIKKIFMVTGVMEPVTKRDKFTRLRNARIKFYSGSLLTDECVMLHHNILEYIERLKQFNSTDMKTSYVEIMNINTGSYISVTIGNWCACNNKYIINIDAVFKEWLRLAENTVNHYEAGKVDYKNAVYNGNSVRVRPYVNDINNILDHILSRI